MVDEILESQEDTNRYLFRCLTGYNWRAGTDFVIEKVQLMPAVVIAQN